MCVTFVQPFRASHGLATSILLQLNPFLPLNFLSSLSFTLPFFQSCIYNIKMDQWKEGKENDKLFNLLLDCCSQDTYTIRIKVRDIVDEGIFILKNVQQYKSAMFEFTIFLQDSRALWSNSTAQENLSSFESPIKAVINKQLQSY